RRILMSRRFLVAAILVLSAAASSNAAVTWPSGQLLPSFSSPAATQDLITISYSSPRWEAEGTAVGHATGHLDGDGWLCQTGVDEAPLFASLKGVVNATQPRIFSYEGGGTPTEAFDWLAALNLSYTQPADKWTLITKYRSELQGTVVYDDAQPDTMNLATTI